MSLCNSPGGPISLDLTPLCTPALSSPDPRPRNQVALTCGLRQRLMILAGSCGKGPGWREGGSTEHEEKKRDERGAHLESLVPT